MTERFLALMRDRIAALTSARGTGELHRCINDVEHLVLSDLLTLEEQTHVVASAGALLASSQALFMAFETTLENSMARFILDAPNATVGSTENITQNYLQRYRTLARHEIELSKMRATDAVLFIGSGPLPITAVQYVRQTGCRVDCIDHSGPAIETSNRVLKRCVEGEHLRVVHARGEECDVSAYDVILVGVLAEPKAKILGHIDRHAASCTRVVCRTTLGVRQFIYPRTEPRPLERFLPAGFSRASGDQVISTQLLTGGGGASGWER
jgi:Nicotianamine synthase protein